MDTRVEKSDRSYYRYEYEKKLIIILLELFCKIIAQSIVTSARSSRLCVQVELTRPCLSFLLVVDLDSSFIAINRKAEEDLIPRFPIVRFWFQPITVEATASTFLVKPRVLVVKDTIQKAIYVQFNVTDTILHLLANCFLNTRCYYCSDRFFLGVDFFDKMVVLELVICWAV